MATAGSMATIPYAEPPKLDLFAELAVAKFRSTAGAAQFVAILQVIYIGMWMVLLAGAFTRAPWLSSSYPPAITGASIVTYIALVYFIIISVRNAAAFGTSGLSTWHPFFNFVVPGLDFYRPYVMMQEIWRSSDPVAVANAFRPYEWRSLPSSRLI